MQKFKEILIILSFTLLVSFSAPVFAYFCAMNPDATVKECASKICSGAGIMGIIGYLTCL
ncbi:hypothetical protein XX58_002982 [Salmonella enterica subsp. salamae]|uniref:Uncharacterized protein n=2 Tax=Salmonella enterica TaxID=28901 RepID=A0A603KP79_SALER|nr:hypothetical protein [Salmonella enterica]EAA6225787.1 hypothetical protein [Salmonella enterica subsp. salamae]EBP3806016.1 hypothetical protein [Salmonella enterica subsp. enterica]EAA6247465.1 hypothetical protein [Salmonella enterica subsp. salamae]EAM3922717.1 hypothetical protein [Salmonella enterica]EAN9128867.1 hypothetical protein [Salmonella enterica]